MKLLKWTSLVAMILSFLLILPALVMAPLAFMGFDAPGSENDLRVWTLVLTMIAVPATLIVSAMLQAIFWAKKKYQIALLSILLPVANVVLIIIEFAIFGHTAP